MNITGNTHSRKIELASTVAILLVAWGVRLFAYGPGELGLDGHLSVGLALEPIPRLLDFLTRDVHPPFFYLALKGWFALVGANEASARWLGVAVGTLTLAVLARLFTSLAGSRGALVSVGLLVLSPAMISASATVRDSSLGLFFSVVSLAAWRALDVTTGPSRRWPLLVLAGSTALALATWYFHLLFVVAQGVSLLVGSKNRRERLLALGVGLVCQLPWAIVAFGPLLAKVSQGVSVSGQPLGPVGLRSVLEDLGTSFAGDLPGSYGQVAASVAWFSIVAWGFSKAESEPGARRGWAVTGFVGLLIGLNAVYLLASRWSGPTLLGRYGLVLVPWAALAQAWAFGAKQPVPVEAKPIVGIRAAKRARRRATSPQSATSTLGLALAVLVGLATIVFLAQANNYLSLERLEGYPWSRHAAATSPEMRLLETAGRSSDLVVFTDLARSGEYALRGPGRIPAVTIHVAGSEFLRDDVDEAGAALAPRLVDGQRVWLLYDQPVDSGVLGKIVDRLGTNRYLTREATFGRSVVDLFEPELALDRHTAATQFGPTIGLTDWAVSPMASPGGTAYVELHWQANRAVDTDYTVFAHLIDASGNKVAQHDGAPDFGLRPTTTWRPGETVADRIALSIATSAQPGTYHVIIGLYHGTERLPVSTGGDSIALGPIEVRGP